jgi:hypothetical protein
MKKHRTASSSSNNDPHNGTSSSPEEKKKTAPMNRTQLFVLIILTIQQLYFIFSATLHTRPCAHENEKEQAKAMSPFTIQEKEAPDSLIDDLPDTLTPRVFPKWKKDFPCYEPDANWWLTPIQRSPSRTGFLFMKEMKTGSSTLAGVHLRISRNEALRQGKYKLCKSRFDHSLATTLEYGKRLKSKSFLWTVLRDPTTRATSQFFHFGVSRQKEDPSDKNFKKYLSQGIFDNYYIFSLGMKRYGGKDDIARGDDITKGVEDILNEYDFIGITERMDESLVVLSLLLNLPLTDVLYLKAKGSGGFDDGGYRHTCTYIVPPYMSPGMKNFFVSPAWKERIVGDDWLYQVANQSLDKTIDALGKELVAEKVKQYKALRMLAEDTCAAKVQYPCDAGGVLNPRAPGCLWQDSGCGNNCLDNVTETWSEKESLR